MPDTGHRKLDANTRQRTEDTGQRTQDTRHRVQGTGHRRRPPILLPDLVKKSEQIRGGGVKFRYYLANFKIKTAKQYLTRPIIGPQILGQ